MLKVIAIGNKLRRDDAIALAVADRLPWHHIIKAGTVPENFIMPGDNIVLIDAVDFGGKPGEVHLLSPKEIEEKYLTTHNFTPLLLSIANVRVIGIQPENTNLGEGLSEKLTQRIDKIALEVDSLLRFVCKD